MKMDSLNTQLMDIMRQSGQFEIDQNKGISSSVYPTARRLNTCSIDYFKESPVGN